MRIRSKIILVLGSATILVFGLMTVNFTASWQLATLSKTQAWMQNASHETSGLLVLTHEFALHAEPRVAYQWRKRFTTLRRMLDEQVLATVSVEQLLLLDDLFQQLISFRDSTESNPRGTEILLGQLLTNIQSLSDQFNELSQDVSEKRNSTEQVFVYTGVLVSVFSLLALVFTFVLLAFYVLRPLEIMRKAVAAVSEGDLNVRSDTGSRDEFGEFSRAFDSMALDLVTKLKKEIAERSKIEENLQKAVDERTANLKAVVDTAVDGIISINSTGIVLTVNKAAEELFGYDQHDMVGQNVSMLMPNPHQEKHDGYLKNFMTTGESKIIGKGRELQGLRKGGRLFPMYLAISKVQLDNETRFTGIVRDISAQKQHEQALMKARIEAEQANRAKSEFLSSMSHELRTPMNAILGFGQLLDEDDALQGECRNFNREILKAGYHLMELINEILDLAQIESGKLDLSLEAVEAGPVVEESIDLVSAQAGRQGITISYKGLPGGAVHADRIRFKQALLNLLSNAIKYNRKGGSVTVSVEPRGDDRLQVGITDTGNGISAAHLDELFQPFNRLGAEASEIEGTGIGLVITRRIISLMSGDVEVESEVGVGSTFRIVLPVDTLCESVLDDDGSMRETGSKASPEESSAVQGTVLYIEDNPSNTMLVETIMERRKNIRLLTVNTGEQGIEMARSEIPDLILLDINMPGMDGYQVLDIFSADPLLQHIPVVAISANAMQSDIERGKARGFADYLTKPLDVHLFNAILDQMVAGLADPEAAGLGGA